MQRKHTVIKHKGAYSCNELYRKILLYCGRYFNFHGGRAHKIFYRYFTDILQIFYRYFTDILQIFYRYFTDILQIFYRYFTDILEIFYRHFTDIR